MLRLVKKDLVEELKTGVQMDFCLRDLALPFLSFFLGNGAGILGNSITEMKATKQFKQPSNVWLLFLSLYIILCV